MLIQDLRFALRLLWKDRWFTAAAATALALGIGVNTTVFTFVNAVLLRGLPFPDADRLVFVQAVNRDNGDDFGASWLDLQDWRQSAPAFEGLEVWTDGTMNVSETGRLPERARGTWISAGAFQRLRQPVLLGRDFAPGDSAKDAPPVVILGYGLWKERYGGDATVLGRVIRINEVPATIVGVMPEGMKFPVNAALWQAWRPDAEDDKRDAHRLSAFGRLTPASSISQAQAQLDAITTRLAREHPETNKGIAAEVMTFNRKFNGGPIRLLFLSLMGAVGFVLLIACANVANLLLARSVNRSREIAVRVALGAARARVVRQLLVESVLLASIGGMLGLGLALASVRAFDAAVANIGKPYWISFSMDWMVFGYLAAVSALTGLVFGMAPALQVSKTNVNEVLKEGGRGQAGGVRARRFTSAMVVVQLALTLVLLAGAGLMVRSFLALYRLDLGIDGARLIVMQLTLPERKYATLETRRLFYERLEIGLASTPGLAAAAVATQPPAGGAGRREVEIDGRSRARGTRAPNAMTLLVGDGYFEAIGAPLRLGRAFDGRDGLAGAERAIVNEEFAARLFTGEDPIGRRVRLTGGPTEGVGPWLTIVGVARNVLQGDGREAGRPPVIYLPWRQEAPRSAVIVGRSAGDPATLAVPLRQAVQRVDADLPVYNVQTFDALLAEQRWGWRVFGTLFAILAGIALMLSSIGIYAVMAYSVAQRRQEIGIRMALGASRRDIAMDVLYTALAQLAVGLSIGLAGSWGVSQLLKSLLVAGTSSDPFTFAFIIGVLVTVTLAACFVPARRAAKVDPLVALRS
jgi:putative ABC transport system permease protein